MSTSSRHRAAFEATRREANIGVPTAQYELGLMYANGVGVVQDLKLAVHWIKRAAEGGLGAAQYLLATRYAHGVAVPRDELLAAKWLMKSYEQGNRKAIWRFGKLIQESAKPLTVRSLLQAAQGGVADAQIALGEALLHGDLDEAHHVPVLEALVAVAQGGAAAAQCLLGDLYAKGAGVGQDLGLAYEWYRRAARQFHPPAQVALCKLDQQGLGRDHGVSGIRTKRPVAKERRRLASEWQAVAANGDAAVQLAFGQMCEHGWAIPKDEDAALDWYLRAADMGASKAKVAAARLLDKRDDSRALAFYRQAAEQGDPEGAAAWGTHLWGAGQSPSKRFQGIAALFESASKANAAAMFAVSEVLGSVAPDVAAYSLQQSGAQDYPKALYQLAQGGIGESQPLDAVVRLGLLQKAADLGHVEAQCALGIALRKGLGCAPDLTRSLFWLTKAAEQGDAKAQWNIGSIYAVGGAGVKQDMRQAFVWCKKAAGLGFVPAQATLGVLYERVDDPEKAVHWLQMAAKSGDAEAQYNLGMMFYKGRGVELSVETAFRWIIRAAEAGLVVAQSRAGVLYMTGDGVAMDPIEAHKWLVLASRAGDQDALANEARSRECQGRMQLAEAVRRADCWWARNIGKA